MTTRRRFSGSSVWGRGEFLELQCRLGRQYGDPSRESRPEVYPLVGQGTSED